MLDKFRRLCKKAEKNEIDEKYIFVSEIEINEELKRKIVELEKFGEEWGKVLQRKYVDVFERQGNGI